MLNNNYFLTSNGNFISEDELYHWGIKGMKWGVRRYQNYDGSYTKAGLKRYNAAMDSYDKRLSEYKTAKTSGVTGDALRLKKAKVKEAKRDVKKHYKHLKQDKLGDKGKILYSEGRRITNHGKVTKALSTIGTLTMSAAAYNHQTNNLGNERVTKALAGIGALSVAAAGVNEAVNYGPNKKLRAYYSHTSNY